MAEVNAGNFKRFKRAYEKARDAGLELFDFDGSPVLVSYAKYVVEYMEGKNG